MAEVSSPLPFRRAVPTRRRTDSAVAAIGPIGFDGVTGMTFLNDGRLVASASGDDLFGSFTPGPMFRARRCS